MKHFIFQGSHVDRGYKKYNLQTDHASTAKNIHPLSKHLLRVTLLSHLLALRKRLGGGGEVLAKEMGAAVPASSLLAIVYGGTDTFNVV